MADNDAVMPLDDIGRRFAALHTTDSDQQESARSRKVARMTQSKMARTAMTGRGQVSLATMRPPDPMWYWRDNNMPYEVERLEELHRVWEWCRWLYRSHPIVGSITDVFSMHPLVGMEPTSVDPAITRFYQDLFFDEDTLDYSRFLVDFGREWWKLGDVPILGQFNEMLGVWESDELVDPEDVNVHRVPFLGRERYEMRLPAEVRELLTTREPRWEYEQLITEMPEIIKFNSEDAFMPVSDILLQHHTFRTDPRLNRGVPILMRAFRNLIAEERVQAAQDGIAWRLYSPLILAKLGASASDLGTDQPWIPTPGDLEDFESLLDAALAGDFRVLTYHFAVDIAPFFGRESMPNFAADFERFDERTLQVFGVSKTLLTGAQGGETYAGDALNFDLVAQHMGDFQKIIRKIWRQRCAVVAEAQEHFDYEVRGGKRYPIMEEILEVDPETGDERIVSQPKLLIPELRLPSINLRSETNQRQFIQALRQEGVPISDDTRLVNIPIDLEEEMEKVEEEAVAKALSSQRARRKTYMALKQEGLPIPDDLRADFDPKAVEERQQAADGAQSDPAQPVDPDQPPGEVLPNIGTSDPNTDAIAPTNEDLGRPNVIELPRNRTRPPQSDERRGDMPRPAHLTRRHTASATPVDAEEVGGEEDERTAGATFETVELRWADEPHARVSADQVEGDDAPLYEGRRRLITGPAHVGSRRYANLDADTPLPTDGDADDEVAG